MKTRRLIIISAVILPGSIWFGYSTCRLKGSESLICDLLPGASEKGLSQKDKSPGFEAPVKSRSIFPNQSVGKKFSGIENPGWDSLINQIPQVASDRKVTESLGSSKESRFIRFALAVKLNTFETPLEPKDLARYEVEIYSAMATAEPPLFHDFQSLALTGFKDQEFEKERAAVQGLLGAAAKENRYAQMIIQDLIIRDFYRDPNQSMLDIAQKYEITPNHPLYSTLMSASNRMPASLYQK